MKYLQILTVDNECYSINLDQQIYIKVSDDDTEVCFYSRSYQLVFTTNEKSTRGTLISEDTMGLLQDGIIGEVNVFTDPDLYSDI
jgi:hypothetical protein